MNAPMKIVDVNNENLDQYPEVICFINPKHPHFPLKLSWLRERFDEGLRIKLLYAEGQKRAAGFIEFVPGEYAWRAVSAEDFMFIHCLYVYPNINKGQGFGSSLLEDCEQDARKIHKKGIAAIVSNKAFMAKSPLFLKNGFVPVANDGQGNELLVKRFDDTAMPKLNDWQSQLSTYQGVHIIYTKQCPWVARLIEEIRTEGIADKLNIKIKELITAAEAQQAPSLYATFNLIRDGRLLADRYISFTRFKNILTKEKLI